MVAVGKTQADKMVFTVLKFNLIYCQPWSLLPQIQYMCSRYGHTKPSAAAMVLIATNSADIP
jgi:hypothetical protein